MRAYSIPMAATSPMKTNNLRAWTVVQGNVPATASAERQTQPTTSKTYAPSVRDFPILLVIPSVLGLAAANPDTISSNNTPFPVPAVTDRAVTSTERAKIVQVCRARVQSLSTDASSATTLRVST